MFFTKMQANGNDYIYIDLHTQTLPCPPKSLVGLCDRHFGIGGDGIVLLCPSKCADFRMRIFDPDGTEAEMCGNALQSAATLFSIDHKIQKSIISVETLSGIKKVYISDRNGVISPLYAEIGSPNILFRNKQEKIHEKIFSLYGISFGNPHIVVLTNDLSDASFFTLGPMLEKHHAFPARTNVEFASVKSRTCIEMRTWERGCGETLSCSTGSAAALVTAVLAGVADREAHIVQRGGSIRVRWNEQDNQIYIFGKTQIVFRGNYNETEKTYENVKTAFGRN